MARRRRIHKFIQLGAAWVTNWRDDITHVMVDEASYTYTQVLKHLNRAGLPASLPNTLNLVSSTNTNIAESHSSQIRSIRAAVYPVQHSVRTYSRAFPSERSTPTQLEFHRKHITRTSVTIGISSLTPK